MAHGTATNGARHRNESMTSGTSATTRRMGRGSDEATTSRERRGDETGTRAQRDADDGALISGKIETPMRSRSVAYPSDAANASKSPRF